MKLSKELRKDIHERVNVVCASADELVERGKYHDAIAKYREALALLPEPLDEWEASTWILTAMGEALFFSRDFVAARDVLQDAMRCPNAIGKPFLHLRLGQTQYELGDETRARDELTRAYMGAGDEIFDEENPKYLALVKSILRPDDTL